MSVSLVKEGDPKRYVGAQPGTIIAVRERGHRLACARNCTLNSGRERVVSIKSSFALGALANRATNTNAQHRMAQ